MPPRSMIARLAGLRGREWVDLAMAVVRLAIARLRLNRVPVAEMLRTQPTLAPRAANLAVGDLVNRVSIAIARASRRVPWRSDCLVQALAARQWLASYGIPTELSIGVPAKGQSEFEAHAWLTHNGHVVTGGDVRRYVALRPAARSSE